MNHLARGLARFGRPLAVLSLCSVLVAGWLASHARIDNSIEVWIGRRSAAYQQYQDFLRRYGNDELIVVAATMPDPLSTDALAAQRMLAEKLRGIDGVGDVLDLPGMRASLALFSPETAERPQEHPLIRNLLLSSDGKTAGVVAWLKPLKGAEARRRVIDAVEAASAIYRTHGFEPHVVGTPVLNVALDRASSRSAKTLLPVACGLAVLVLVGLLRSTWASAVCLASAGATVLWTIAVMTVSGSTLNLISVVLPALLVVLSLSPAIHLASRFQTHRSAGESPRDAAENSLRELTVPIVLTTGTTIIGFASLMVTEMQPVFEVGLFAAVGMLIALVFTLGMVPGLLILLPANRRPNDTLTRSHWTARWGAFSAQHRRSVAGVSLLVAAVFCLLVPRIRTESNILNLLSDDSQVVGDYRFVSEHLTGLYTLELDVAVDAADESTVMPALQRLAARMGERTDVARVDTYGEFAPMLWATDTLARMHLAEAPMRQLKEAAAHFRKVENGKVHLRASILVRSMASRDFYALVKTLRTQAASLLPASSQWNITGAVLLLNDAQAALVRTQVRSFAIAAIAVLVVMGLLFRSWRVVAASIVPNLLPVLGTFALMVLLGIAIDSATVMIASVAIGLAVDSTIHFIASYRDAQPREGRVAAAANAMQRSGRPIVFTALVAIAGFAMLCLSSFRPLADFGLLTGATLLTAMICDLLVTPAWAASVRLWEQR